MSGKDDQNLAALKKELSAKISLAKSLKSLPKFLELFTHAAPGFLCEPAGNASGGHFVASVIHGLNDPASAKLLKQWAKRFGNDCHGILEFYGISSGFCVYAGKRLYEQDDADDSGGILLYALADLEEQTEEMISQFDWLREADMPFSLDDCVAIGEVYGSSNFFCFVTKGDCEGKIVYLEHDPVHEDPVFAKDFDDFLFKMAADPVGLLNERLGCYTRYSDGKTDTQWIPVAYLQDVNTRP